MKNHTTLPYHLQMIQPTEAEIKAQASLKANKMSLLFDEASTLQEVTLDNLYFHLHIAMMLELSTIPPYLCALYSIQTGDSTQPNYKEEFGDNAEVAGIIRSVMMEEMLHLTLVGNILNAVGGPVKLNDSRFIPEYPTALPDSNGAFQVNLAKFSPDTIRTFLRIEQPTPIGIDPTLEGYDTIGQFYHALMNLMEKLEVAAQLEGKTIFTGDPTWQIDSKYYYGGGGGIIAVTNMQEARDAFEIILEQGEGTTTTIYEDPDDDVDVRELAHYFKYNEISEGRKYAKWQEDPKDPPQGELLDIKYDKVYNMMSNPKNADYTSVELKAMSDQFNSIYSGLLDGLQSAFSGNQDDFIPAVASMYKLKYLAIELMNNPVDGTGENAGPTFEYNGTGLIA